MCTPFLEEIPSNLLADCRNLSELGITGFACPAEKIIAILDSLTGTNVAVLGGDVYDEKDGVLVPAVESWYCNRDTTESLQDYADRSRMAARDYVNKFPWQGLKVYFSLVTSNEPTAGWLKNS